jgi:hypothetical protein
MNQYFKAIEKPVSTRQEIRSSSILNGSGLTYTLCDRTVTTSYEANFFSSFNLPYSYAAFPSGSTLSLVKPELQQLNVNKIVVVPIPREDYNEIIDGRSITFTVPQLSGSTSISAKTVVSSTYTTLDKEEDNELIGSNIAFLFCDEINKPFTGTTNNRSKSHSANTTWNPSTSFVDRPAATSYLDLKTQDINSDTRSFAGVSLAIPVTESYPNNTNRGYNYDIPIGFIALDKGWCVFTHPSIVDNIPFIQGFNSSGTPNTGSTSGTTDIYFTSTTTSTLSFEDLNVEYKTTYIALVAPGEFYISTNPSWDFAKNFLEQQNETNGFDPVYISEIGLFNIKDEMIAVAKLDQPLEKNYGDLVTFTLDINI